MSCLVKTLAHLGQHLLGSPSLEQHELVACHAIGTEGNLGKADLTLQSLVGSLEVGQMVGGKGRNLLLYSCIASLERFEFGYHIAQ